MNPLSFFGDLFHTVFYLPVFNILMLIYGIVHSFPLAIILMTLLVRSAMIPLFRRQLKSSKAMQEISPEVQKIQREFRSEPMVMQQKLNALYKEHGVNPYASCLPTIAQLPFLYGLYGAFHALLANPTIADIHSQIYPFIQPIFGPNGLTQAPNTMFFALDLAHPDPTHLLPIIAGVATFVQIRMSLARNKPQAPANGAPDPNAATMKMMQFLMPGFTLFIGWTFPAGLALYWTTTTLFTIGQQYFVNGRNWGGLLDGTPWATPKPAMASGIVDSTLSNRRPSMRTRVSEEASASGNNGKQSRIQPAIAAATNGNGSLNGNDVESRPRAEKSATPSRPLTSKPTTNTRPTTGKKDAVRLVTPTTNSTAAPRPSNGNNSSAVVVNRAPKSTIAATPRVAGTASANKSKASASRARKKGR